ncbi:penicillin-binding transpeptidase domain-containing protein [Symbiobacterium thermophilum]|uniref:Peptidoglycan glycosyltransferase n=1 Tax=Symbiobacterium thermophilum TaxID=2734 RepID=A0A953I229_SYMTR|nr:penicillin-binding transpeptidase domain-containing protein [Symbiobacterium thermophilum]MBY6276947.1 peptidoglycan glycosyltransferase [Symbiobacterium thermophilum]
MSTGVLQRRRTVALIGIFALVFTALTGRMVYLQIAAGDFFADKAFRYRMRPVPIQADRGQILDRNGYPLLTNRVCESVYAEPILIQNKAAAAQALAPILNMEPEELEKRMSRHTFFEWLKRKVDPEVAAQVKALNITGIGLAPEKCRYYPEDELAVHVLGIANLDHQGIEGLELTYNEYLKGQNGQIQCEYTARGLPMEDGECHVIYGTPGHDLVTTLDVNLQRIIERDVERAVLETRAQRAAIIVMDVKTGEILALAQWPRYDPELGGNSDPQLRRIFTVADALNPGSIFKPITAAAALDSGVIDRNTVFNDTGCMTVEGWTICNWDRKGLGSVRIDEIMAKSSNVGFGTLGMWLGADRFYEYHSRFGLDRPTGIDLPGEATGQYRPKKDATAIDLAVQAYGQTLTATPIQMLTAIAAIANDGKLMWPHLGKAIYDHEGNLVKEIQPREVRQVVAPEVARYVQELMVGVVENGTGKNARVAGYQVGGKTGTANKVIGGRIAQGKYIASFVGFAPYPDPQVAVLISIDEPQGAYYGGQIAAPIFGEVMGSVLAYLDAPKSSAPPERKREPWEPEPPKDPEPALVPPLINLPVPEAEKAAREAGFAITFIGDGSYVVSQFPLPGATAYKGGEIVANLTPPPPGSRQVTVPALSGLSLHEAARTLAERGLLMQAEGRGAVYRQDPPAGTRVPTGTPVKVFLKLPERNGR